jgi:beta-catenin-like protein 1
MLDRKNQSMQDILTTLRIYHDNVDEEPSSLENGEEMPSQKEILQGLILALETPASE